MVVPRVDGHGDVIIHALLCMRMYVYGIATFRTFGGAPRRTGARVRVAYEFPQTNRRPNMRMFHRIEYFPERFALMGRSTRRR